MTADASLPNVLVVDDERRIRDMLQRILTREGFGVRTANGPDEAVAALETTKFDAVVLDVRMPEPTGKERSGLEVLAFMRKHDHLRSVPVLIVTGSDLTEREEQAIWGLQAYVLRKSEGHQPVLEYLKHLTHPPTPRKPA
jgi:CheY-like chemotaxis protein